MGGRRLVYAAIATALVLWLLRTCAPPRPHAPVPAPDPPADLASRFDAARCGTVLVHVDWSGMSPAVPPIELIHVKDLPGAGHTVANPNAPDVESGRLTGALVFLVGLDAGRSRAWDLPPVSVEARKSELVVRQGKGVGRMGVVRRGAAVELVSREAGHHSIRGRGAAFFTQMLPHPDQPISRALPGAGVVELSSGTGHYWVRAYLLVSDHPYAAITGADGSARLAQVPDGQYEAVCWVPNWQIEKLENDPEWVGPVRLSFRPAVERRQRVVVRAGEVTDVRFTLSAADFGP